MKIVYVAGPYSASNEYGVKLNIAKAETLALAIWQSGNAAICPHLNTAHWGSVLTHAQFIVGDLEILRRCDAVLMVEGWLGSTGAIQEREFAYEANIPVFYELKAMLAEIGGSL